MKRYQWRRWWGAVRRRRWGMGSTARQRKREAAKNVRDAEIPRCAAKMVEAMRRGRLLREAVCNLRKAREEARNG